MTLTDSLGMVLAQTGAGAILFSAWLPTREIRGSFFALQSFLGAALVAIATLLRGFDSATGTWAAFCILAAMVAGQAFRNERPRAGRALMLLAGAAGLVVILSRILLPTAPGAPALGPSPSWFSIWYPFLFTLGGLLLLGATHTAMVLGHWYLLMRGLSFVHLIRFCRLAVAAVIARGGLLLFGLGALRCAGTDYEAFLLDRALRANSFFFGTRLLLGLAGPLVFGVMALRCARLRANQAATGLLYLSEAFVFFGEVLAAYLLL